MYKVRERSSSASAHVKSDVVARSKSTIGPGGLGALKKTRVKNPSKRSSDDSIGTVGSEGTSRSTFSRSAYLGIRSFKTHEKAGCLTHFMYAHFGSFLQVRSGGALGSKRRSAEKTQTRN